MMIMLFRRVLEDLDLLLGLSRWGRPMLPLSMTALVQQLLLHVGLMCGLLLTHLVQVRGGAPASTTALTIVGKDQVAVGGRG